MMVFFALEAEVELRAHLNMSDIGEINAGWVTTFNQYAVVSENRITKYRIAVIAKLGLCLGAVTTGLV